MELLAEPFRDDGSALMSAARDTRAGGTLSLTLVPVKNLVLSMLDEVELAVGMSAVTSMRSDHGCSSPARAGYEPPKSGADRGKDVLALGWSRAWFQSLRLRRRGP